MDGNFLIFVFFFFFPCTDGILLFLNFFILRKCLFRAVKYKKEKLKIFLFNLIRWIFKCEVNVDEGDALVLCALNSLIVSLFLFQLGRLVLQWTVQGNYQNCITKEVDVNPIKRLSIKKNTPKKKKKKDPFSPLLPPISKHAIDRVKCSLGRRLHVYMKKKKKNYFYLSFNIHSPWKDS